MQLNGKFQKKHKVIIIIFVVVCAMFAYFLWLKYANIAINSSGGMPLNIKILCMVYKQNDPQWKKDKLGSTSYIMASAGCTVSCCAMALSVNGHKINPGKLNEKIQMSNGYTKTGLLIWNVISRITNNKLQTVISNKPSYKDIDNQLQRNNPVIAKIYLFKNVQHWVLITGKQDFDYLIHDPLGSPGGYEKISSWDGKIYAIRYFIPVD